MSLIEGDERRETRGISRVHVFIRKISFGRDVNLF